MSDQIVIAEGEKWVCSSEEWDYDAATRTLTALKPKGERKYPDPERVPFVDPLTRSVGKPHTFIEYTPGLGDVVCLDCGWQGNGFELKAQACPLCDGRCADL